MTKTAAGPPINMPPDVAARIDKLGLRAELNRVAAYTVASIPTLSTIRIVPYQDPLEQDGMRMEIVAVKESPYIRNDPERSAWLDAVLAMISPAFRRWFIFDLYSREMLNGW